ncbi:MAG: tetratricopeptide repeat protein [Bacteroides sp.]|nr:tetratricopeptide repeat protein [Bacteroides sp.]
MNRFLSIALCLAAAGTVCAQKANVDQANKLAGKIDQIQQARELIQQAMQNPETQNDPRTYFVAGKIEFDAYDKALSAKMINPNDPSANDLDMANELVNGYKYFLQALPLDSLPNEKGQVKPKYSKDILNKLGGHHNDFFTAGANFFNEKKYYPEAYEAFMIFGDLPESGLFEKGLPIVDPQQIPTAYFNAGLSAYSGNQVEQSAAAFKKARNTGYEQPESFIYEIACWQNIAQNDESKLQEAQAQILDVARAGHEKFGLEQPIFINNMINSLVTENKIDQAISQLNDLIAANPDNAGLYGLRGYVYDRAEKNDLSEADYRKAASIPSVDFETLKNACKKIFRIGTEKWNEIEGASAEATAARQNIKTNYFEAAKKIADQAEAMQPGDPDMANVMESITYALETYFN